MLGLPKEAIKTSMGTKTTTVTHLSEVQADQLCKALNDKLLGARILTASGVAAHAARPWSRRGLKDALADANSALSRAMLLTQVALFAGGFTAHFAGASQEFETGVFVLVVCLGHTLVQRAVLSLLACRITIHVLMFMTMLGAVCLGDIREAATVALIVGGSEWLVGYVNSAVEAALQTSLSSGATHARRLTPAGAMEEVPIEELRPGDTVLLRSGEVVPVDGQVVRSHNLSVDEASVTGEALPLEKAAGASVFSGTVVVNGTGDVKCTAPASESFQGRMQRAVEDARSSHSPTEEIVNCFASFYTPLVIAGAAAMALATGKPARGLAALVGACPCALVAAAPIVQACGFVRLLSDLQVLVKHARAFEGLGRLGALGVDKTGTLTDGLFKVGDVAVLSSAAGRGRDELFTLLAALESRDPHPLASSIVSAHVGCVADFAAGNGLAALPPVANFTRVESKGVWGIVNGIVVGAGSAKFLEAMSVELPDEAREVCEAWEAQGNAFTAVYMTIDEDVVMVLRLEDSIRADAAAALSALRSAGVEVALLTGDSRSPAVAVASKLRIKSFAFSLLPAQKETWVRSRKAGGQGDLEATKGDLEASSAAPLLGKPRQRRSWGAKAVGMLGDGLNDSPALAAADVGVAVACGLQLTADAADVVITKGGALLLRFARAVEVAKRGRRLLLQNLALALAIKLAVVLLAATGNLTLSVGVLTDSGSLLLVLLNGMRPLTWRIRSTTSTE